MSSILISASLGEFVARERTEHNVEFFASHPPAGKYLGIIPTVTDRIGAAEIDGLEGLRVIANYGVGYDNIDVGHARAQGVSVTNTPGVLTTATAELTWALILAAARRIGEGERLVRSGDWRGWQPTQLRGMSLDGKVLGIVGAGRIGREVGRRAAVFGMRVLYFGRTRQDGLEYMELDKLLRAADVVSIHLPRSAETEGMINAQRLAMLRAGAILINTARGSIVDEDALVRELVSGRIRAGLDVYAHEPRVPEALQALENVVLLPHLGSATYEARQAMWELAWRNLVAGIRGDPLITPVG